MQCGTKQMGLWPQGLMLQWRTNLGLAAFLEPLAGGEWRKHWEPKGQERGGVTVGPEEPGSRFSASRSSSPGPYRFEQLLLGVFWASFLVLFSNWLWAQA